MLQYVVDSDLDETTDAHPEIYPNLIRQFDLLTEFINGPCLDNQNLLLANFSEADLDLIILLVKKDRKSFESPLNQLQTRAVTFLIAFTEGNNKEVIEFIGARLDPNQIFKHMISLVKELYIRTKYVTPSEIRNLEKNMRADPELLKLQKRDPRQGETRWRQKKYNKNFLQLNEDPQKPSIGSEAYHTEPLVTNRSGEEDSGLMIKKSKFGLGRPGTMSPDKARDSGLGSDTDSRQEDDG
jgi:hypothetical protein